MLTIDNLSIRFAQNIVLNQLSAEFENGKIHGIVGHNGSGKTTFFNLLAAVLKADEGHIFLNEKPLHYQQIAYLETHNFFYSNITGEEYLALFPQTNSRFMLDRFQQFFQLPLEDLIETYSTGMKKKLALLAILKQEKELYLFDEPFNGLDLESNKVLEVTLNLLKERQKMVFISSHVLGPLLEVCDYIHYLDGGNLKKTYSREGFYQIEQELFDDLKERAKAELKDAW